MPPPVILSGPADVPRRGAIARGPLAPLAASLAADLAPLLGREPFLPPEKARMTRAGGRCPRDGVLLAFDPYEPRRHRCPACGAVYDDEVHYRWWIMWYQLWLAERAVHGAALGLLTGDVAAAALARDVLARYADRYLTYPNQDNVLGPTRLFFSTYLESIWLLQICVALDLLEAGGGAGALGARVREAVIEPSRAIIARYDEGGSNRQVWNAAALAAAARLLGDDAAAERAVLGAHGVAYHLDAGLLADGTWFEGENYHQFAHRGLWYGVAIAERAGIVLPAPLVARFAEGFVAPFLTALPDLTLPARRDSQWAISLRQWRYAESCELGLARRDDPRLSAPLAALYAAGAAPPGDTGRWRSAAESERNEPARALTRADLGWRSLLFARAELPPAEPWAPASVLLPAQGIAIFRRQGGRAAIALDYGVSGGGHGHPDRLDLLLADGARRWLDDMGTGSYVERKLHWYRSTLAHNAPLVDGRSQERVDGTLLAHDEHGTWGWVRAAAAIAPGVVATRTVVAAPDYVVDRVEWTADRDVVLDLPMHVDADLNDAEWRDVSLAGAGGLEDGFDFLADVRRLDGTADITRWRVPAGRAVTAVPNASAGGPPLEFWVVHGPAAEWLAATAPAAPGRGDARFLLCRTAGRAGVVTTVWSPRGSVVDVRAAADGVDVRSADGDARHRLREDGWRVERTSGHERELVELRGLTRVSPPAGGSTRPRARSFDDTAAIVLPRDGARVERRLGENHYRPSELDWAEAGCPGATVRLRVGDGDVEIAVAVTSAAPDFVRAGTENPLDNERAEVNGDGVQLHVVPAGGTDAVAWLLVPDADDVARTRVVATTRATLPIRATSARTGDGYVVTARLALADLGLEHDGAEARIDVLVNETAPGRERRRGQLVLSGRRGEFVYLQGDRHAPERYLRLRLAAPAEIPVSPTA